MLAGLAHIGAASTTLPTRDVTANGNGNALSGSRKPEVAGSKRKASFFDDRPLQQNGCHAAKDAKPAAKRPHIDATQTAAAGENEPMSIPYFRSPHAFPLCCMLYLFGGACCLGRHLGALPRSMTI